MLPFRKHVLMIQNLPSIMLHINILCATVHIFFLFLFFFFGHVARHVGCGISVPRPGIEPAPPAVEAWNLNHWIAREVPIFFFLLLKIMHFLSLPLIYLEGARSITFE